MINKLQQKNKHQYNTISTVIVLIIFVLFVSSCKQKFNKNNLHNPSPYFTNFYTGNENAVLRDIDFNMSSDDVKKIEQSKLYEKTPDHLFYEFSYPKDSTPFSEYANIQYFFNENNQLDIITTDIFLDDSTQQVALKNTLIEYFDKRYKTSENENQYNSWTSSYTDKKTNKDYDYTISLKDLDDDFGVSIEFYLQD